MLKTYNANINSFAAAAAATSAVTLDTATKMASSSSHRHQPRSPAGVGEVSVSPCTSPPTMTGRLSTVTSPRLQLSPCPSSGVDSAGSSPRGCRQPPPPRKDTTTTAGSRAAAAATQRQSTAVRRVLSDTDSSSLPVWRGANMAQSQLMQRRRRQMLQTQQKSRVLPQGVHRTTASAAKRLANYAYILTKPWAPAENFLQA